MAALARTCKGLEARSQYEIVISSPASMGRTARRTMLRPRKSCTLFGEHEWFTIAAVR